MYKVGDYVVYGTNGVCQVKAVGRMDSSIMDNKREYYTLVPIYSKTGKIYVPVDSEKVFIRKILSKEEAVSFVDEIKDIEKLWVADEKTRENTYKEALRKQDCREYVRIIKTIYSRKEERISENKKVTATDERYFRMAEEQLYGELAVSLSIKKEDVQEYISNRMK